MTSSDDQPFLHVDDDWKAQAQAEKAKLAEKQKAKQATPATPASAGAGPSSESKPVADGAKTSAGGAGGRTIPPADFHTLVNSITSQALFSMGAMPDPQTGQRFTDLAIARHHIDTLGVLEEKTMGNLTDEESQLLSGTLYELRASYVQVANASRSPATGGQSQ